MNLKYTIYTEIGQLCKVISTAVFTNQESKPAQRGHLAGLYEQAKGSTKIKLISRSVLFTLKQTSSLIFYVPDSQHKYPRAHKNCSHFTSEILQPLNFTGSQAQPKKTAPMKSLKHLAFQSEVLILKKNYNFISLLIVTQNVSPAAKSTSWNPNNVKIRKVDNHLC